MERHGFSSPTPSAWPAATGELSPMAFLVGVTRANRSPPPGAPRSLSPAVELAERWMMAGLSDGAPPSPLKWEEEAERTSTHVMTLKSSGSCSGAARLGRPGDGAPRRDRRRGATCA